MRRRLTIALLACAALAAGACGSAWAQSTVTPSSSAAPASSAAPGSTVTPASSAAPASSATPASGSGASRSATDSSTGAIVLLALVGALLLVPALTWAAARWRGWEPRWWLAWRHATGEAMWRASASWAEFVDWLRLGR